MAGNAVIGALRVVLGADTAALEKGLKDSRSSVAAFGSAVATGMAAAAAAVAVAAVALGAAMQSTINDMDRLSKSSQKLGVPIEQLSALSYAADLSDVSFESLSKSVAKLSRTMVEAAAKPTAEAANAFRALGVSVKESDGTLKSSDAVLGDIAERFAGLKDGAGKTAAAIAIFGRSGADLIPLLNGGRDGLQQMGEEAAKFGIIVDAKAGKAAEDFNDNLTRLKAAWSGIILQATSQVLPSMVAITNALVDTAKNSGILSTGLTVVSTAMKALVSGGVIVGAVFKTLAEYISTVSSAISMVLKGQFAAAFETVRGGVSGVGETATNTFGIIDRLWKGSQSGADAAATSTTKAVTAQKEFNYAAMGGKNAFDSFIESQKKSLAGQQAELQTIGMVTGAREALKVQLQGLQIATDAQIPVNEAFRAKLAEVSAASGEMALKLQGAHLVFENQEPLLAYQAQMANTELAMRSVGATADQIAGAQEKVAEKFGMSWASIGTNIAGVGGALSNLTGTFAKENKAMGIASKAFGIGQAIINTQIAITKALATLPPPASYAAVALAVAQGAASVASISAQKFAMGGAFRVPGGIGGGDRVPFNAMLEPGELVEISSNRPGGYQSSGGDRNSPAPIVNLSMPIASTREAFASLIDGLNGMFSDGYVLKVNPV